MPPNRAVARQIAWWRTDFAAPQYGSHARICAHRYSPAKMVDTPQALFAVAVKAHQSGRLAEAAELYRRILATSRKYPDVLHLLGVIEHQFGNQTTAAGLIRESIALESGNPTYHNNLASALLAAKDYRGAAAAADRALALQPGYAQATVNLREAHYWRGRTAQDDRNYTEAADAYRAALRVDPVHAESLCNLCFVLTMSEDYTAAIAAGRAAIAARPAYTDAHNNLGYALHMTGEIDAAVASYTAALTHTSDYAPAHNNLGNIYKERGENARAAAAYRRAIVAIPDFARAHFNLSDVVTFTRDGEDLQRLDALAARVSGLPPEQARYIHYAMGKALDDVGETDAAFQSYAAGAAIVRGLLPYDEHAALKQMLDAPRFYQEGRGAESCVPIFIIGMPRSGTTLVEQILASHPAVCAGGERRDFELALNAVGPGDLARLGKAYLARLPRLGPDQRHVTDKLPANFVHAGLIHAALPQARFIHVLRDPADTCVSCFSKLFDVGQEFTYDLAELGRYYVAYRRLMDHWRAALPPQSFIEITYETLVGDLEGETRRLLDFCGLQWDAACLSFHDTKRLVQTASATQVRKPLYASSIGRARRVRAHIEPLLTELAKL